MAPIPRSVILPMGYQPLQRADSKGKNEEWQCPVIGCERVYTRKRPLMEHMARPGAGGHLEDKLIDTSLGTFTIKTANAEEREQEGDDVPSPALSPALAAGLGVDLFAALSPSPSAPSMTDSELLADAAEVAAELSDDEDLAAMQEHWDSAHADPSQAALDFQAAPPELDLQAVNVALMVPGWEEDYADLSDDLGMVLDDLAPPPPPEQLPKKRRKTGKGKGKGKGKVETEHRYASLQDLRDEEIRRQIERREQGFASDITVVRDSGGFEQDPESAELDGPEEQRRWVAKQVKEKNVAKAAGVISGKDAKRAKAGKGKKGTDKKQLTIKESIINCNKNGTPGGATDGMQREDDTGEGTVSAVSKEKEQNGEVEQEAVDEEMADLTLADETENGGEQCGAFTYPDTI